MSSEWHRVPLSSIATYSQGIQIPPDEQQLQMQDGYGRFVRIIDFTDETEPSRYIKKPSSKYYVDETDVVMIRYGSQTAGKVVRGISGFIANNMFKVSLNSEIADRSFIYRFLSSQYIYDYLRGTQSSTTMPAITFGMMNAIELPLPPKSVQKSIACFFDSLDDRIALLRETNTTLETISQAMFKSWFVDFDPVHAKQQGRVPDGMDEATAALFPDSFEQSAIGPVPKMWEAVNLGKFLTESTKRVGRMDAIVLSAIQSGELVKSSQHFHKKVHSEDIGKYKAVPKYSFAYNPSRINIGSIGMNEFDTLGAVSPIYVVVTPETIDHGYFLWHQLKMNNIQEKIKNLCSGTVRQSLSFKDFISIPIVLPSHQLMSKFSQIRKIFYNRINKNNEQIEVLTSIRETLLPRLISGQLRLPEVTEKLEEFV